MLYYEEKLVDGELYYRINPNGEWWYSDAPYADAVGAMAALTDEQRLKVMQFFCAGCGCIHPEGDRCQCWNDE